MTENQKRKIIRVELLETFAEINDALKADKDVEAVLNNLAKFDENGNPVDSGINVNDLSAVTTTGDYNDLLNKPTIPSVGDAEIEIQKNGTKINSFTTNQNGSKVTINISVPTGTAADKNVPSSGNASATQVVMGNDTRLSDSRPASDVYSWAKAESKPSYTKSEIGLENVTNDSQVKRSEMGAASGVATLDENGKVPSSQLPSYVDDVLEYNTKSAFPTTGETGKIYVDKSNNTTWRWSGSTYSQIKGDLVIGTNTGTAADGKIANDHYSNTNNPHSVTKSQVGLGSVVNTGDSATPISGGTTKFTTGGAYTELNKKVDKVDGKGLSTNDYTTDEKNKLSDIESGAQKHKAPTAAEVKSALGTGSGTSKYLREDGTWVTPPDHTYTVNNGTFMVKGAGTNVSSTSANASSNTSVDIVAGSNVTITPDATNGKITISSTDTNSWRPVSDSVSSTDSSTAASSKAVKTAYDLAASKTSNTGTVTSVVGGTGLNGGTISTSGTLSVKYGTSAGTACEGNDSRLSNSRPASDVYSWAKANTKPSYNLDEVSDGSTRKLADKIGKTINTTWANLKNLRDNSQLVPGQFYRITDYECTTTQENTQSAGHQFDIIVRADDVNVLNENASAALHEGDTYFADCNLTTWKLKYTIDNINWSSKKSYACTFMHSGTSYENINYLGTEVRNGTTYHKWDFSSYGYVIYASFIYTENLAVGPAYADSMGQWMQVGTITNINALRDGKGTITYIKDEYNNECPYDFKNIQFKRWKVADSKARTGINNLYMGESTSMSFNFLRVPDPSDFIWAYTFSNSNNGGKQTDLSLLNTYNVYNNVIKTQNNNRLPNNVLFGINCHSNTFENNCYNNTFNYNCYFNIFRNNCCKNIFTNTCYFNIFGNNCYNNVFGGVCYSNILGNSCYNNTFGEYCNYNIFGNNCYKNVFNNNCYSNMLGNDCFNNKFINYCCYNTFNNRCYNNTFLKEHSQNIIFENNNIYITLTSTQTTSNSNVLRNIKICQGVNNTTTTKTISHDTVNDTFQTEYKATNSQIINV